MIISEMRSRHMSVKVLGLDIEREHICQQGGSPGGDLLCRVDPQACEHFQRSSVMQCDRLIHGLIPFPGNELSMPHPEGAGASIERASRRDPQGGGRREGALAPLLGFRGRDGRDTIFRTGVQSALDKGQQVRVQDVGIDREHPVREARIGLDLAVL